jgi:hypothetical protein
VRNGGVVKVNPHTVLWPELPVWAVVGCRQWFIIAEHQLKSFIDKIVSNNSNRERKTLLSGI